LVAGTVGQMHTLTLAARATSSTPKPTSSNWQSSSHVTAAAAGPLDRSRLGFGTRLNHWQASTCSAAAGECFRFRSVGDITYCISEVTLFGRFSTAAAVR
jgi:hypothetical protein